MGWSNRGEGMYIMSPVAQNSKRFIAVWNAKVSVLRAVLWRKLSFTFTEADKNHRRSTLNDS